MAWLRVAFRSALLQPVPKASETNALAKAARYAGSMRKLAVERLRFFVLLALIFCPVAAQAGALFGLIGNPQVHVNGFGWFADLYLERSLEILDVDPDGRTTFDNVFLEDAVWILVGEIQQKGYLKPKIDVTLTDGAEVIYQSTWDNGDLEQNPKRGIEGDSVVFTIRAGRLYYFDTIQVTGLPSEITDSPASFFYSTDQLFVSKRDRFFTDARFQGGINRILQRLRDLGYRDAKAVDRDYEINDETGAVAATLEIEPGPIFYAQSMVVRIHAPEAQARDAGLRNNRSGQIITLDPDLDQEETLDPKVVSEEKEDFEERRLQPDWVGQASQTLRRRYFAEGYPEVFIEADFAVDEESEGRVSGELILSVFPGESAVLNEVKFEGGEAVAPWLLERQADLETGDPLNRTEVEEGRNRLARLGVFRRLRINYEEVEPGQWDVIYELDPKGKTEIDLIFGVGSFDIVRGGFEIKRNNLWSVAHRADLRVVQSFKATYADLGYTIPQIFGQNVDSFSKINYLRREELTFLREEWGASSGLQYFFADWNINSSVLYTLDNVRAADRSFVVPPGPTEARIGSFGFRLTQSDLDSPVFPTDGYHWFLSGEFARPFFGGDVDFNSFELGGAYHYPLFGKGLILHLGFKHGVIFTNGSAAEEIPVNRRFFLGGENTVRGYKRDQASPVDQFNEQIGAVSYMLWQGELEQKINETFSIVAFVDTVGNAAFISDYPFNEILMSVGGGISIRTIIGPLRFEYGYNVIKRDIDPDGRFQVGLGFPF